MHVVTFLLGVLLPGSILGYVPYPARNFFFRNDNTDPLQSRQFGGIIQALFNAKAAGMMSEIAALQTQTRMQQTEINANRILQKQNNDAQTALIQANKNAAANAAAAAAIAATAAATATLTRKNY